MTDAASHYLDITQETCPLTFVRTKLMIERMPAGSILELRLKGEEPLRNIPRSLRELHHQVLSLEPEDDRTGIFRMTIRKG